jgi:predicted anti-sigma-YlaC factor YlaD
MTDRQMMTCAQVDAALLDYLEETLDGIARAQVDEHVASCLRCNSLLRDIGAIRAEAGQLPELTPSRDLWA